MKRCPITYESVQGSRYSPKGLRKLSPNLDEFHDFPYSQEEQIREAQLRSAKMSLQGVQPKLSVRLDLNGKTFRVVDQGGLFILKPQSPLYRQLPENEDLCMRLASAAGIEAPFHGMVYCKDGSLTYFIRRFDRSGRRRLAVEDFAQIAGRSRDTKYDYSMEKMVPLLEAHCTFPQLEKLKLFRLTLFNYLIGNEDAHLKNFSLIRRDKKVQLSPAYDLLSSTIALEGASEELALPLRGKKRNFNREIFIEYFGKERLQLPSRAIDQVIADLNSALPKWISFIGAGFLSEEMKERLLELIGQRRRVLGF
ncbi:MAG: HipA domain-containing protein [Acidobacteriota bacterium]